MNPDTLTPIAIVLVVTLSVAGFVLWQRQTREDQKKRWSIFALLCISAIFIVVLTLLEREFGANSIFFACVVAFVPLGWMAFVNEVVELSVPERLRTLRPWELSGIQYRALGVPVFGAILRGSVLRHLSPRVYLGTIPTEPTVVCRHLAVVEAIHVWATVLTLPYLVFACLRGWWLPVVFIMAINLVANLYPIMHLRWAHGRMERLIKAITLKEARTRKAR